MKRIKLLILLFPISMMAFSQSLENNNEETLKLLFLSIPDSVFNKNFFNPTKRIRRDFWELYSKKQYHKTDTYSQFHLDKTNILIRTDSLDLNASINLEGKFIRLTQPFSDAMATYDIKCFDSNNKIYVGITLKSSNHATIGTDQLIFYIFDEEKYIFATNEILSSFNYYTDNFDDTTINILSHYYSRDLKTIKFNEVLLYNFTKSDTVYISKSFFDIPIKEHLDNDKHFDGEFYTKKYIMENGKLRLAE